MSIDGADLAARLANSLEGGQERALWLPLMRLLAAGKPVDVSDLAHATGRPIDAVSNSLAAFPDTEYDDENRIVGQGLTLRPTRHQFTVDGQQLYTWCALDTLIFPALLSKDATIQSTSPTSGETVHLRIEAGAATHVEPPTAVVSLVNPEDLSAIRSAFCNQVHYFTSPEDAQPWLDSHPGGEVRPVQDAYQLATAMATTMLEQANRKGPTLRHGSCC